MTVFGLLVSAWSFRDRRGRAERCCSKGDVGCRLGFMVADARASGASFEGESRYPAPALTTAPTLDTLLSLHQSVCARSRHFFFVCCHHLVSACGRQTVANRAYSWCVHRTSRDIKQDQESEPRQHAAADVNVSSGKQSLQGEASQCNTIPS